MLQIHCLKLKKEKKNIFSRFAIGPFKKGQGLTFGNAFRRMLLSDLQGLAIAGAFIPNVSHEFSLIPNVKEDLIDILLNLKQIVLKGSIEEPILAKVVFQGPGFITAKDIILPSEVALVDPNQYIATVTTKQVVTMDLLIQVGEGYSTHPTYSLPEGFLFIDSVYMPVIKVNFFLESLTNINSCKFENLVLEITTNGSITPIAALNTALINLRKMIESLETAIFTK